MMLKLSNTNPRIAAQWDRKLNGDATPDDVSPNDIKRRWWHCEHNHPAWSATPAMRIRYGYGCPYCEGREAIPGETDLGTTNPELAAEYATDLNKEPITHIRAKSSKNVWWRCRNGHEWQASPRTRTTKHTGCRYCANRAAWPGFNDLASKFPEIAKEFDEDANGIDASHVVWDSHKKKYQWRCAKGHTWKDDVRARTVRGTLCPQCHGIYMGYGNRLRPGVDDLLTVHPELRDYWDSEYRDDVSPKANRKFAWKCPLGHRWTECPPGILKRESTSGICPFCGGIRLLKGFNDLATTNPEIAEQWDQKANGKLKPSDVLPSNSRKVGWICEWGHRWTEEINRKVNQGVGCTQCSGWGSSIGENEVLDYIDSILPDDVKIIQGDRTVLHGQELDIYVPSRRFAVEYNGLYWHSEAVRKDRNYHKKKVDAAGDAGVSLLQVWEDDWRDHRAIIKDMIAYRLHADGRRKLNARSLSFDGSVPIEEMRDFLNANHIQGDGNCSIRMGLRTRSGKLVAAMCFMIRHDGSLNLDRYATLLGCSVRGGFTKLLHHAIDTIHPGRIITFSDHASFDGKLYSKAGFHVDAELHPDYSYIVGSGYGMKRVHKFDYRKRRFKNDPNLIWKEGMTESQLASANNLLRVWDSGKTRWALEPDYDKPDIPSGESE